MRAEIVKAKLIIRIKSSLNSVGRTSDLCGIA